jgi:hypothetical protein
MGRSCAVARPRLRVSLPLPLLLRSTGRLRWLRASLGRQVTRTQASQARLFALGVRLGRVVGKLLLRLSRALIPHTPDGAVCLPVLIGESNSREQQRGCHQKQCEPEIAAHELCPPHRSKVKLSAHVFSGVAAAKWNRDGSRSRLFSVVRLRALKRARAFPSGALAE